MEIVESKFSLKKAFVNTLWFGIVPKLPSLINVILLPFITPYLTAWDYGIWGTISAYSSIATAFCSMGLNIHLSNSYYEYGKKYQLVWGRLDFLFHIISIIASAVLFIVLWNALSEIEPAKRLIVSLLSLFPALFYANQLLASHLYPLRANPRPLVIRNFIASVLGILSLYFAVVVFKWGYIGFVLSAAVTACVAYFLFLYPLRNEGIHLIIHNRKSRVIRWFLIAIPVIPNTLGFALLSSATRIIMDVYDINIHDVGIFTNGVTIGNYVVILTSAMASAFVPQIQEYYRCGHLKKFRYLFYLDVLITWCCIVLFSIWMKEIYTVLIRNDELYIAYSIAQLICFANLIYPFYHFTSSIISIQKKTQHILWLVFVPGILCVVMNLVFIPIYGYKSAVVISIVAYWSQYLLPLVVPYLRKVTEEWIGGLWKLPVMLAIFVLSILFSRLLSDSTLTYKILSSLALVGVSVYLLVKINLVLNPNDKQ